MKNKIKGIRGKIKNSAVTLIELLIAIGISSIVIVAALGTVGNVYFIQKRAVVSQNFYAETRLLMEKIVQVVRNNTIDYDRYFQAEGPPVPCTIFAAEQVPGAIPVENNAAGRGSLEYSDIFYWDTNGDDKQDRNLGGVLMDGTTVDDCSKAFDQTANQEVLYVINGTRSRRVSVETIAGIGEPPLYRVAVTTELGIDNDGDGEADEWESSPVWDAGDGSCRNGAAVKTLGEQSEEFCQSAHERTAISSSAINVKNLSFYPYPDRDPFLSFRVDESQSHPHVFVSLKTVLWNYESYGFDASDAPKVSFQTSATSRVFGNPRR